jgi:spore coat assembly protein SafA
MMVSSVSKSAPPPRADADSAGGDKYTVQKGDTLWDISQKNGLALQDVIDANPQIKNPDLIFPGQEIKLPAKAAADAPAAEKETRQKQDPAARRLPQGGVDPQRLQQMIPERGSPAPAATTGNAQAGGPGNDLVPNQFALGGDVGASACGPAALVALEKAKGKDIGLSSAVDVARNFGWNTAGGMNGFGNFARMANDQGLNFQTGSTGDVKGQVEKGNPVVISTAKHYFVAQAYDAASGKFFFGNSGTALRAGSQWLTLDQVASLGGGINGVGWSN